MQSGGRFRYAGSWEPLLIVAQIVCAQAVYYLGLGCCLSALALLGDRRLLSLQSVLDFRAVSLRTSTGRLVTAAISANALLSAGALWWLVQRTKLCLDFSLTQLGYHVLLVWCWCGRLPATAAWWLVQTAAVTLTCVLAEFLCMRSEMAAIPVRLATRANL